MIDTGIIRENYSRMTDDQLMNLLKTEGQELTPEALSVLHDEFLKRKLDLSFFVTLEDDKTDQRNRNIEKARETASSEFLNAIWNYAFDAKKTGISNEEIQKGHIEIIDSFKLSNDMIIAFIESTGGKLPDLTILENHEHKKWRIKRYRQTTNSIEGYEKIKQQEMKNIFQYELEGIHHKDKPIIGDSLIIAKD